MKKILTIGAIASAILGALSPISAYALDGLSGAVDITNDYRENGISLSDKNFSAQGTLKYKHSSGAYVGTKATSVDEGAQFNNRVGYAGMVKALNYDFNLGLVVNSSDKDRRYWQGSAKAGYDVGLAAVKVGFDYGFGYTNPLKTAFDRKSSTYFYGDLSAPIPNLPLRLVGHIGSYKGLIGGLLADSSSFKQNDKRIFDYKIGIAGDYNGIKASLFWVDTNVKSTSMNYNVAKGAVIFKVGTTF